MACIHRPIKPLDGRMVVANPYLQGLSRLALRRLVTLPCHLISRDDHDRDILCRGCPSPPQRSHSLQLQIGYVAT